MKITLFLAILLCATTAFAQASASAPTMQSFQVSSHPEHASPQPLATEQNLLSGFGSVYMAQGERPLWEFAPVTHAVPLGDTARNLKKDHEATAKKARVVWEN